MDTSTVKMTGWTSYSTYSNLNVTDQAIGDIANILYYLEKKGLLSKLMELRVRLQDHMGRGKDAHQLQLHQLGDVGQELYRIYVELEDFPGTYDDMLQAILFRPQVVTIAEAVRGEEDSKAVDAFSFRYQFKKHNGSKQAHKDLFTMYTGINNLKYDPSLYYSANLAVTYQDNYSHLEGYVFPVYKKKWNPVAGIIVTTFIGYNNTIPVELWRVECSDGTSLYSILQDGKLHYKRYIPPTTVQDLFALDLYITEPARRKVVFQYTAKEYHAVFLPTTVHTYQRSVSRDIEVRTLTIPYFTALDRDTEPYGSIVSWVYYPGSVDRKELSAYI